MIAYGYKSKGDSDVVIKTVDKAMEDFAVIMAPGTFLADVFPVRTSVVCVPRCKHAVQRYITTPSSYECSVVAPRSGMEEEGTGVSCDVRRHGRAPIPLGQGPDGEFFAFRAPVHLR